MKILILTMSDFGGRGGIAKYTRDFIKALLSSSTTQQITVLPRLIDHRELRNGLPSDLEYCQSAANSKWRYLIRIFKMILFKRRVDLVICGHTNLLFLAALYAKLKRSQLCLLVYGVEAWDYKKRGFHRYLLKQLDAVIAISHFTKDKFLSESDKIPHYILNCAVDFRRFTPGDPDPVFLEQYQLFDKKIMLTLGRLDASERYKGFDELIELMPSLLKTIPDLVYVIAGEGSDRSRLENKVKQLGLTQSVLFLGYVEESKKLALYRSSNLFVMPGRGEGFGIVYLEARACGLPVIGSKLDASREALLEGELGLLVDPNNPDEMKAAIIESLNTAQRSIPDKLNHFSIQRFDKRLHCIVKELVIEGVVRDC